MGDVVTLPQPDPDFGGCPRCGRNDGFLNVGSDHWAYCRRHKTRWLIGSNLFSGWRHEDETMWLRNRYRLDECGVVDPVFPKRQDDPPANGSQAERLFDDDMDIPL